jgi:hypothetical protein
MCGEQGTCEPWAVCKGGGEEGGKGEPELHRGTEGESLPMSGSAYDLRTPRGTRAQMIGAVRILDLLGATRTPRQLSQDEIAGLEENARRVAERYWALKGTNRTAQSLQNQLNRPRWHYMDQAPYARNVLLEVEADSGMTFAFYP